MTKIRANSSCGRLVCFLALSFVPRRYPPLPHTAALCQAPALRHRAALLFSRRASVEAAASKHSAVLKYTLYSLLYSATVVFVTALATARDGVP